VSKSINTGVVCDLTHVLVVWFHRRGCLILNLICVRSKLYKKRKLYWRFLND